MTTLIEAGTAAALAPYVPTVALAPAAAGYPDGQLQPSVRPITALSRTRGGMYSSTVDLIRFADGSTAHTDLIRLNPNIDAYSVDFAGVSPRRLAHYREAAWRQAPAPASRWHREITRLLANSYPAVPTAELTRRLREHGYPGTAEIRRHEAIAATQAAIWRLTNGLELDTQPLDVPVAAHARIGDHPSGRQIQREAGRLNWHTPLPAGEAVHLELTLAEALQLRSFSFALGARTGRHEVEVRLEQSPDGVRWSPVSRSAIQVGERRPAGRHWHRRLGTAATLSSANPAAGQLGHRHYRLTAQGPWDRDGLLDLRDIRLEVGSGRRFRNNERVVHLYELLLAELSEPIAAPPVDSAQINGRSLSLVHPQPVEGPEGRPDVSMELAIPRDALKRQPALGVVAPGPIEESRDHRQARLLIGSSTPTGPAEFTPLVALLPSPPSATPHHVVPIRPELRIPGLHPSVASH